MPYNSPKILAVCTILIYLFASDSKAQTIPVGSFLDQQIQIQRLLSDSIAISPILRPYTTEQYTRLMDENTGAQGWWNQPRSNSAFQISDFLKIEILPFSVKNTVNSRFPVTENNGAAWYGRGYNVELQGGLSAQSPYFTIDIRPHVIYQENQDFLEPRFFFGASAPYINEIGGAIDAPYRFGPDSFNTIDWGNSSIRFHSNKFETGFSSEPLWWGASQKYPLMMSNNAPGIHHFFLGTRERVKIPKLGWIHFKWMMGYPQESEYFAGPNSGITRFMNAANISYSPSFYPNLTLGFTRAYHLYQEDGLNLGDILVLFDPIRRVSLVGRQGSDETRQARNQTASIYLHLSLPTANAEIYAEFFREDHSFDFRDLFVQPHHNSAYAFGFQKISYFPWFDFIKTNLEITNLTTSQLDQVRRQDYYYSHSTINQGHTNRGQILGAAIGPGSNSQFLSIDGFKNQWMGGLFLQRVVNNDNLHFKLGSVAHSPAREFGDYFRHWVDMNAGFHLLYDIGSLVLQKKIMWTKSHNYGRFDTGSYNGIGFPNHDFFDRTNVQLQMGITYFFK